MCINRTNSHENSSARNRSGWLANRLPALRIPTTKTTGITILAPRDLAYTGGEVGCTAREKHTAPTIRRVARDAGTVHRTHTAARPCSARRRRPDGLRPSGDHPGGAVQDRQRPQDGQGRERADVHPVRDHRAGPVQRDLLHRPEIRQEYRQGQGSPEDRRNVQCMVRQ
jgi:hypothetical protein